MLPKGQITGARKPKEKRQPKVTKTLAEGNNPRSCPVNSEGTGVRNGREQKN